MNFSVCYEAAQTFILRQLWALQELIKRCGLLDLEDDFWMFCNINNIICCLICTQPRSSTISRFSSEAADDDTQNLQSIDLSSFLRSSSYSWMQTWGPELMVFHHVKTMFCFYKVILSITEVQLWGRAWKVWIKGLFSLYQSVAYGFKGVVQSQVRI